MVALRVAGIVSSDQILITQAGPGRSGPNDHCHVDRTDTDCGVPPRGCAHNGIDIEGADDAANRAVFADVDVGLESNARVGGYRLIPSASLPVNHPVTGAVPRRERLPYRSFGLLRVSPPPRVSPAGARG